MGGPLINIHAVIPRSRVNGPGLRMVVFFQGCKRACPGCFNPETHPFEPRLLLTPEEVLDRYLAPGVEGLTVSGGEPFMQVEGLTGLLKAARLGRSLTTVVYTGLEYREIEGDPAFRDALGHIDVLIDGPYEAGDRETTLLARGSRNQRFHFLTPRYDEAGLVMPGRAEVTILGDGAVAETGFGGVLLRTVA
jgi:anaerobic ribonucleoside-triphosphate reductase activating protein